jgi:hypothetical protein
MQGPSTLGIWQDSDVVAAHYRVVAEAGCAPRLIAMAPQQSGLDTIAKFTEVDEAGNKVSVLCAACNPPARAPRNTGAPQWRSGCECLSCTMSCRVVDKREGHACVADLRSESANPRRGIWLFP